MTYLSPSQRQRTAAPNGSRMRNPDYLEALAERPVTPGTLKKKMDDMFKAEKARRQIERERIRVCREAVERKRREKLDRLKAMAKRDRGYLDRIRKRAETKSHRPMPGQFQTLANRTAEVTHLPVEEIMGKCRKKKLVFARHALIRLTRLLWPSFSTLEIGRKFNMDHTSVLWALGGVQKGVKLNEVREARIEAIVDEVMARLKLENSGALIRKQSGGE